MVYDININNMICDNDCHKLDHNKIVDINIK